jgi:hypothetical protein
MDERAEIAQRDTLVAEEGSRVVVAWANEVERCGSVEAALAERNLKAEQARRERQQIERRRAEWAEAEVWMQAARGGYDAPAMAEHHTEPSRPARATTFHHLRTTTRI